MTETPVWSEVPAKETGDVVTWMSGGPSFGSVAGGKLKQSPGLPPGGLDAHSNEKVIEPAHMPATDKISSLKAIAAAPQPGSPQAGSSARVSGHHMELDVYQAPCEQLCAPGLQRHTYSVT